MKNLFIMFAIVAFLLSLTPVFADSSGAASKGVFQQMFDSAACMGKTDKGAAKGVCEGKVLQNLYDKTADIGKKDKPTARMETGKANTNPLQAMYEGAANFNAPADKKPVAVHSPFQATQDKVASIGTRGTVPVVKNTVFQKASENISRWNDDYKKAEPLSLRTNKQERARRMMNLMR